MSTNFSKKDFSDWITLAEAARLRGVTRQAIGKLVKKGRLDSLIIGGQPFVSKTQILNYEAKKAGRPKKEE